MAGWFPDHTCLHIFLFISHWGNHLQTSNSITPALDMPGSRPPSQRRRTRLTQPIWPCGRPTPGPGKSPRGVLPWKVPAFPSASLNVLPHWPTCASSLTALEVCLMAVVNTAFGVKHAGFQSHSTTKEVPLDLATLCAVCKMRLTMPTYHTRLL